jgi:ribosome-associated toxin RatA of RatAB toxin-antitoxin module
LRSDRLVTPQRGTVSFPVNRILRAQHCRDGGQPMREIRREALVPYAAERMFELIERVEDYPLFLPWCRAATLISRSEDSVSATVEVGLRDLHVSVTTRNEKRAPEFMSIMMDGGSFRHFYGEWTLRPLGDAGCHVHFMLRYELALRAETLAGRLIDQAADRVVDAFVRRADAVLDPSRSEAQFPSQPRSN